MRRGSFLAAGPAATALAAAVLAAAALPAPAAARPVVAWAAPALARVLPTDPAPAGAGAAAGTARLAAARGETESFQIVVRAAGGEPLGEVSVGVTELTGPGGAVIRAADVALFREHYVEVRRGSPASPAGGEAGAAGLYPDALVPFVDPATGRAPASGAKYKAQPFAVEAGRNQPVWVDVAVPRSLPPGTYRGGWWARSAQGGAGGQVELTVWRATLPETPTLRSSFNQWNDHSLAADRVLVDHKVMPLWTDPAGARKLAAKGALNASKGALNASGLGFWSGAEADGECRVGRPPSAAQIVQRAAAFPRGPLLYNLIADGVDDDCPAAAIGPLQQWAEALHAAGVANLVVGAPDPRLLADAGQGRPAVDIWAVGPAGYHAATERVRAAAAGGAEIWGTTTLDGDGAGSPAWLLDRPPIAYRLLPGYVSQSLGLKGLLYWAADYWPADPWTDVEYRTRDGQAWPGEGLLVYPGAPAGATGVVPSIRLKHVRDGVEDYDLLLLARAAGLPGLAKELEAVGGRDWRGWATDPDALEASRRRIGEALDRR